ncbi:hypothetical protein WJX74_010671 [Apatococcus lobatus]|uniref:Uncharacterized protein n=1 Tax=Apatococcus lobatus TaxID=904363 RepID=A0AAW1S4D3_9CHLO
MARGEQEAASELRRPLLQPGQQQQQQQPATAAPAAAAATRPSRGAIGSEDTDGLTKWGPIAVVMLVLLACAAFAGTIVLLSGGPGGDPPPLGRKGCAAAVIGERQVFHDAATSELDKKKPRSEPGPRLLVWGGKGRHQAIFNDLYELDLIKGHWRRMAPRAEKESDALKTSSDAAFTQGGLSPASGMPRRALGTNATALEFASSLDNTSSPLDMPPSDGLPRGRWKMVSSGIPTRHGDGMVVYGGDTLVKAENKGDYLSDVWLLQPKPHGAESAVWHPSTASDSEDGPEGRRAAAGAVWHGPGQTVPPQLLVHGGRNKRGDQLNDLWSASLDWPNVDWTLLDDGSDSKHSPEPRKGHTATMRPGPAPHLLIYGGRDESDYFDDLWAYDLEFKSWERWLERGSAGPMGRDHHAAVVVGNQFIIYGGRGGASYKESKPLSDIWSLDLTTMNWTEVTPKDGPLPPARFLHSFDMFLPPKSTNGNDLIAPSKDSSAKPYGIVERRAEASLEAGQGSEATSLALSGALMQDEAQLAGRKLMSSKSPSSQPVISLEAIVQADGSTEAMSGSTAEHADSDDEADEAPGEEDDDDEQEEDDSKDGDDEEDEDSEDIPSAAAAAGTATAPSLAPSSGDLDKHHHHHHHHHHHSKKHHHHHNDDDDDHKHHDKHHGKHHKGGLDPHPGPAGGSYSDAKLVVFGGQGEGGCYLNDAWEFDPHVPAWRQISRLVSDDKKCIALQGFASSQGPRLASRLFGGLGWGAAQPML